jgi:predicted acetyltransferase
LALEKAREIGLRRVLITCDATNIASRKIIEANGGQLQDERLLPGRTIPTRRYWVELDTT